MNPSHGQGEGPRRSSGPLRPVGALRSWSPIPAGDSSFSHGHLAGPEEEPSPAGLGAELPSHPVSHKSCSEQQQSSHGNTCVFYIFPPKRWVFKYSSSTIRLVNAARVYDRSLLLKALK